MTVAARNRQRVSLAPDLQLTLEIFATTSAIMGIKGSGKTNDGVVLAEQAVKFGVPVVVIDPTSVWWGLKSSADGRSAGLPFYVFGGSHGDVPLEPEAGAVLARFVVDYQVPTILDVSDFSKKMQRRFVGEFCEELYHIKNRKRDPLYLILDEVARFAPQTIIKGDAYLTTCLGAVEDIVSLGRSRGLGCAFIGQRAATINNNVLTQADNIFAMRTVGTADRKAIDAWVVEAQGDPALRDEMVRGLASLQQGEGYFWSPAIFNTFKRVRFAARETFDSSRTPTPGEKRIEPRVFAAVDLDKLRGEIAESVERKKADDPKALREQIKHLKDDLTAARAEADKAAQSIEVQQEVQVPVLTDDDRALLRSFIANLDGRKALASGIATEAGRMIVERVAALLATPNDALAKIAAKLDGIAAPVKARRTSEARFNPIAAIRPTTTRERGEAQTVIQRRAATDANNGALKAGQERMLVALARCGGALTKKQLAVLADVNVKSGTFSIYLRGIVQAGFAHDERSVVRLTPAGRARSGVSKGERAPSREEIISIYEARLKAGERRMLQSLLRAHPRALTKSGLAAEAEVNVGSGTFSIYLRKLVSCGLADVNGRDVTAGRAVMEMEARGG